MRAEHRRRIVVGTESGLFVVSGDDCVQAQELAGREITALARAARGWWAIVEGRNLWRAARGDSWLEVATVDNGGATCLLPLQDGLYVGTESAHLLRLRDGALARVRSFDAADGREEWYTPWGDPADVRSMAVDRAGAIYVNIHVGGVVRSRDDGRSWEPTLDIETDVHQVIAHPTRPGVVLVAAAVGFGASRDGGDSWKFRTDGLHATYLRAVAVSGETLLVTASTGPGSRRNAVYRKALDRDDPFERCREGLPEWFRSNIDTECLAARGSAVALGTDDGSIFSSADSGGGWKLAAKGLPPIQCVAIA
jgi:hypothetical protein